MISDYHSSIPRGIISWRKSRRLSNSKSLSLTLFLAVITLTTCGNRGSVGPRTDQCDVAYNQTDPKQKTVRVSEEAPFKGFQLWAAPNENYYT